MKPSNYHIACSPLSNRILAGIVNKSGTAFTCSTDVTGVACGAVIEHVLANKAPVMVTVNGIPKYKIIVEELNHANDG
jgi:hypothetical protein